MFAPSEQSISCVSLGVSSSTTGNSGSMYFSVVVVVVVVDFLTGFLEGLAAVTVVVASVGFLVGFVRPTDGFLIGFSVVVGFRVVSMTSGNASLFDD